MNVRNAPTKVQEIPRRKKNQGLDPFLSFSRTFTIDLTGLILFQGLYSPSDFTIQHSNLSNDFSGVWTLNTVTSRKEKMSEYKRKSKKATLRFWSPMTLSQKITLDAHILSC